MAKVFHPCRTPVVESIRVLITNIFYQYMLRILYARTHPYQTRSGKEIKATVTNTQRKIHTASTTVVTADMTVLI